MDDFDILYIAFFAAVLLVYVILGFVRSKKAKRILNNKKQIITEKERAGIRGEVIAAKIIYGLLEQGDYLFQNVEIEVDNRPSEFDNIVVNKHGVFIFEVKNYKGKLEGTEDDYEWSKYTVSKSGNTYMKTVKNPIKQVRREIYLLSQYLKRHGVNVWVDGYVMLMNNNSPVESENLVWNSRDIDMAIHLQRKNNLSNAEINRIVKLLQ